MNGADVDAVERGGFWEIARQWTDGDVVVVDLPMGVHVERIPDGSGWASVLLGPVVMAARGAPVGPEEAVADLATSAQTARGTLAPLVETPVLVDEPGFPRIEAPTDGSPLRVVVATDRGALVLEPFAGIHDARYCVYFPLAEPDAAARRAELAERDAHALTLDGRLSEVA